jgi:hypothetical protein
LGLTKKADLSKGFKAKSPIDLDSADMSVHEEGLSRSPIPTLNEAEQNIQALIEDSGVLGFGGKDHVPLETTGTLILNTFSSFFSNFFQKLTYRLCGFPVSTALVAIGSKSKETRLEEREAYELGSDPSVSELGRLLCTIPSCILLLVVCTLISLCC